MTTTTTTELRSSHSSHSRRNAIAVFAAAAILASTAFIVSEILQSDSPAVGARVTNVARSRASATSSPARASSIPSRQRRSRASATSCRLELPQSRRRNTAPGLATSSPLELPLQCGNTAPGLGDIVAAWWPSDELPEAVSRATTLARLALSDGPHFGAGRHAFVHGICTSSGILCSKVMTSEIDQNDGYRIRRASDQIGGSVMAGSTRQRSPSSTTRRRRSRESTWATTKAASSRLPLLQWPRRSVHVRVARKLGEREKGDDGFVIYPSVARTNVLDSTGATSTKGSAEQRAL